MKADSSDIDKDALRWLLEEQYGLRAAALRFVPRGEESYGYVLETAAQARYFCKVYEHPSELSVRYEAANKLHTQCGLDFVVHPHATRSGTFHASLGELTVAVYDYVDGTVSDASGFSDREWAQAARLTASLHQSIACPALPALPVERFELWFEDWLASVLRAVEEAVPQGSACEREARALLAREKDDILAMLASLRELAARARTTAFDPAVTHGDLTPDNLILDRDGRLHLIDWSKLAIAPRERDLVNLVGERFEPFLRSYVGSYDVTPELHPELFAYYRHFLVLWAIADYGSWILLEDGDPEGKEHAWAELQRRVPVDHGQVRAEGVAQVIRRVMSVG